LDAATDLNFDELANRVRRSCLLRDRHRLTQRLRGLQRAAGEGKDRADALRGLAGEIDRSCDRLARRQAAVPASIAYPPELPVVQKRDAIAKAIADNQVIVLCGETGSGKTTQLPKICLELGRGVAGMIGHTQPRRVAARSVAVRIADELSVPMGSTVGYKVRFGDKTNDATLVKLMTDGILLAELSGNDRFLDAYDTLIIDEAHERSLNIDFILGYLKTLLPKRPDLKLIITSATINPQQFSKHFDDAPIIEVSGRTYPVETRYRPLTSDDPEENDLSTLDGVLHAADELAREGHGDMLVFLPGEREIRETAEALRKHHPPGTEILPLYARLSADEQMKVFKQHAQRRIVLATNVAETSLTVPGIRYVIDPGIARISRYSPRSKVQRLPIERVSQASADQRKGRCGRVSEGVCVRLYSEEDFLARPQFTDPEILRTNLASVILQMKALRLGDVQDFPFVEPPDYRQIRDGYQTLNELGAVDEHNQITPLGRDLARLPVDPRIARMILAANDENALREVLVIAAALSVQDPRERPLDAQQAADAAHAQWKDERSDFLAFLKLWTTAGERQDALSNSQYRKWCKAQFLSYIRMREWADVHRQLHELVTEFGFRVNDRDANYDEVHRALLAGLLGNVGEKGDAHEYTGRGGTKFSVHPGSGLFGKGPRWVMAGELVQTTRLYARNCALIKPEWVERVAAHLVKRAYFEPHYVRNTASVGAYEKVSLYGLVIVPKRRVQYGPIDPKTSRELFIQAAFVEQQYETDAPWARHNAQLQRDVELLEAKVRRRNILTDAKARYDFYDARVPAGVYSGQLFEQWRREAEQKNRRALFMALADLIVPGTQPISSDQFPEALRIGDLTLPLRYVFDPGAEDDGVTVRVPLAVLNVLPAEPLEWLVPGLLATKIEELIRTLPKQIRVKLIPAPEVAAAVAARLMPLHPANASRADSGTNGTPSSRPTRARHPERSEGSPPSDAKRSFAALSMTGAMSPNRPAAAAPHAASSAHTSPDFLTALAWELGKPPGEQIPRDAFRPDALPDHLRMNVQVVDDRGKPVGTGRDLDDLRRKLGVEIKKLISELPQTPYHRDDVKTWDFGDLPAAVEINRPGIRFKGYPAIVDAQAHVNLRLLDNPDDAAAQTRGGVRRLFLIDFRDEISAAINALPDLGGVAVLFARLGTSQEFKAELRTLLADRLLFGDDPTPVRTRAAFQARLDHAWDNLRPVSDDLWRLVRETLKQYQATNLDLSQPTTPLLEPSVKQMRADVARLVHKSFLTATPWPWLRQLPRMLKAVSVRLAKLKNAGLAKDQAAQQKLLPWLETYARLKDGLVDHNPAELESLRWMLEEYRVSLFAQELKTSITVSEARLQDQADRVRAART